MSGADRPLYVDHTGKLGGAELSLLDLMAHRPGAGLVVFEDGAFPERAAESGQRVVRVGGGELKTIRREAGLTAAMKALLGLRRLAAAVAETARETGAGVLYANSLKAMIVSSLAGRSCGLPVIWHVRDLLTAEHFSRTNLTACRWVARWGVYGAVANSRASAKALTSLVGGRVPVRVVYNGFDPKAFAPCSACGGDAMQPASASIAPVLGLFARLAPWKGQHVAIDALAELDRLSPGADSAARPRLRIVGEALFGEDAYADELRRQADRLGLADRVEFLGFRDDVPALLHCCDVVIHSSTSAEPFGRAVVEAMLAGRPVVATDAGGVREIIDTPDVGRLVPPGDVNALAGAIAELLAEPEATARMAEAGRAQARTRFSLSAVLPAWDRAVAELLDRPPKRTAVVPGLGLRRAAAPPPPTAR